MSKVPYFYGPEDETPLELGFVPRPIADAPRNAAPTPATPGPRQAMAMPGMTAGRLGAMAWEIKDSAPLEGGPSFADILQTPERILVPGSSAWTLLGRDLKPIAVNPWKNGVLALDAERALAYAPNGTGTLTAFDLKTGRDSFQVDFNYDVGFQKPLVHRFGERFLVVALEEGPPAHSEYRPHMGVIEVRELAPDEKPKDDITNTMPSKRVAMLLFSSIELWPALLEDGLVLAGRDAYYLAGFDLRIKAGFTGNFQPLFVGSDAGGLIHMAVRAKGGDALWVLDQMGKRFLEFPFSPEWGPLRRPPVIAPDHNVHLVFARHLVSVSALGRLLWAKEYPAALGGVSAMPDGFLLVSAGSELVALEPDGKRNVLARLPGESLGSRAVFTPAGEILVAGAKALHRLVEREHR